MFLHSIHIFTFYPQYVFTFYPKYVFTFYPHFYILSKICFYILSTFLHSIQNMFLYSIHIFTFYPKYVFTFYPHFYILSTICLYILSTFYILSKRCCCILTTICFYILTTFAKEHLIHNSGMVNITLFLKLFLIYVFIGRTQMGLYRPMSVPIHLPRLNTEYGLNTAHIAFLIMTVNGQTG